MAVLGLGAMGLQMAGRLAGQFEVTGYDPAIQTEQAPARGVSLAASAELAVQQAAVVVLAVRTLEHAEQALFAPSGAGSALRPGSVVMLTSTVGAPGARALASRLSDVGVLMVDLPVSGGPRRAGLGDLLVFAAGSETALTSAHPVIDRLASRIFVAGPNVGDAQSLKAVNQLLCGVHIAAAAEALVLARSLGLDPHAVLDVLGSGAAASFMLADRGPRIIQTLAGEIPAVASRVDIFVKDMGIVLDAGKAAGVAMPVAAATEQLFRLAGNAGLAAQDDSATASLLF